MFCIRKGLDIYRNTWRQYILALRAHDEDRLDQFEYTRMLGFCSLMPYLEKGTRIESFWSIPERDSSPDGGEKVNDAKKFMDEVTERYKKFYNR